MTYHRMTGSILHRLAVTLLLMAIVAATGCGTQQARPPRPTIDKPQAEEPHTTPISDPILAESLPLGFEKIKFKLDGGETAFSLKAKDDGGKLVDASEMELARYNLSPGKLKIKDREDNVLAYIVIADTQFKLEDAEQTATLWKFQRQSDGDWKLEDGLNQMIYKVKQRDYGYEVEAPSEASIYKVKVKDDKTSLRDAEEQTVLYTKDNIHPLSAVCFGLDAIQDQRIKAGLAVAVQLQYGGMD